jgi:hypothetical protein
MKQNYNTTTKVGAITAEPMENPFNQLSVDELHFILSLSTTKEDILEADLIGDRILRFVQEEDVVQNPVNYVRALVKLLASSNEALYRCSGIEVSIQA